MLCGSLCSSSCVSALEEAMACIPLVIATHPFLCGPHGSVGRLPLGASVNSRS